MTARHARARVMSWRRGALRALSAVALVALVVGLTANLFTPLILERQGTLIMTVVSGSMTPGLAIGTSILVDTTVDKGDLRAGDVITFLTGRSSTPVTHRVTERFTDDADKVWYRTRGDANEDSDPNPVALVNVVGKVSADLDDKVTVVPLGQWLTWARSSTGRIALFGPAALQVIFTELAIAFGGLVPSRHAARAGPETVLARSQSRSE